jgi:hypothetical protein
MSLVFGKRKCKSATWAGETFCSNNRNKESKAKDAGDVEDSIEDIVGDPYDDNSSVNKHNFNDVS